MNKDQLRQQLLAKLKLIPKDLHFKKSEMLSGKLLELLEKKSLLNLNIAGFSSFRTEPRWFSKIDKRMPIMIPSLQTGREMHFVRSSVEALGEFQGMTPSGEQVERLDVIVLPGVAFSKRGDRLGRGKGFYDRFLANKDILKIGVCFEEQLFDSLPSEQHDIKVNYVVTETRVLGVSNDN